ncbi:procathepsin L-like [Bradysia coprophila]|uniref:procathepsin L-like n=1 Tax=Bradysia coprophila TaxID=38358 RepID=UPI00187D7838|nr:procathepsin L-like [Bradysia coprophila]
MMLKLLPIVVVLIHLVESNPQFGAFGNSAAAAGGLLNKAPGVGQASGLATGAVNTAANAGGRIADSLKGLIENFGDFKTIFKKNYISEAEERLRGEIFKANLAFIGDHNELFKQGKQTFSLAINFFGDWTHDEYLEILGVDLSQAPDNSVDTSSKRKTRAANCDSPDELDWRKKGAVTPVKNQMKCASCWAFAAAGALESHFFIKNHKLANFSEQQFVDCSISEGKGCKKGFMNTAFEYSTKNGLITDDKYPYKGAENGKSNSCNKFPSKLKIQRYETIPKGNEEELRDAVCRFGPVSVALDASSEKFMHYNSGIYRNSECSTTKTTHGALVVGYGFDENTEEAFWILKNSYSDTWGEDGYVRIPRDFNNHCGIANLASYPIV